tara:strand:- start:314 stop:757 length:444 start_codon:yes stop_codon:yes gene_type:complete
MNRKLFLYIFIYTLLVGCNIQNPLNNDECESDFTMNVEAPELEMDENGYYHIEWLQGYNQTFATLEAVTNTEGYNRIYWASNDGIEYGGEFVSCVNSASYTSDGVARQTMAVWEEMIGDTITIAARFEDWCYNEHIDYIRIIIEDEI